MTLATAAWGHDGLSYSGKDMRQLVAALSPENGAVETGDFLVAAQASPNATVQVAAGRMVVPATGAGLTGSYEVWNDASINSPSFSPTAGNGRWDYLILRVTAGVPALEIVQGTAAAFPAAPTITGDNYEPLALVKLPGSTTNITGAMITDARNQVVAPAAAYDTWTPTLSASGGGYSLGNGTLTARYQQTGKRVHAVLTLVLGSTTSFGTGSLQFTAPVTEYTSWGPLMGHGYVNDTSGNIQYVAYIFRNTQLRWRFHGIGGELSGSSAVPMTFAVGDTVTAVLDYEAA